jgi:hypothetical protein
MAETAHVSISTARRLRKQCVDLGLLRETGVTVYGVPKLEISIPRDYGDHGDDCTCGALGCKRRYLAARVPEGGKVLPFRVVTDDQGGGQN